LYSEMLFSQVKHKKCGGLSDKGTDSASFKSANFTIQNYLSSCGGVLFVRSDQIFFYPALKFSSNCPHATANFALAKTKFVATSHKRPHRKNSILQHVLLPLVTLLCRECRCGAHTPLRYSGWHPRYPAMSS
jgi:hypothetical protein